MKIFITGSTGFVGSNFLSFFDHFDVECFQRNGIGLKAQLDSFQPNWIINCAAEIYNTDKMWSVNVEITKVCVDWIVLNPRTKMIQIGSSSEYGVHDSPTSENSSLLATDIYGTTKAIASLLCISNAKSFGLDIVVVRPYSLFGPKERDHRLFPKLWRAFKYNQAMQLVEGVHDFCYIDDFVRAVETIMFSKNRTHGDVVNISSGIQTTNSEVLDHFRSVTGIDGAVTKLDKFCTQKVWQADITHIKNTYGWNPSISVRDGIEMFLNEVNYESA